MKHYDLVGVDGNAYAIMGYVSNAMKETSFSKEQIERYSVKAKAGDYDNLLRVSIEQIDECNKTILRSELERYIVENISIEDWELEQGLQCIGELRAPLPDNITDAITACVCDFNSDYEDDEIFGRYIDPYDMPEDDVIEDFFFAILEARRK